MGSDRYLPFLPIIVNWIQQTLDAHAHERRAVSSFNFPRLPHYFLGKTPECRQRHATVCQCRPFLRSGYQSLPTSRVNRPEESRIRPAVIALISALLTLIVIHGQEILKG